MIIEPGDVFFIPGRRGGRPAVGDMGVEAFVPCVVADTHLTRNSVIWCQVDLPDGTRTHVLRSALRAPSTTDERRKIK